MIGNDVLTLVEMRQSAPHTILDRSDTDEFFGEECGGVGQEHVIEIVPVLGVEGPRVPHRQIDDRRAVDEQT